jgi:uncharacterized repeat protein (TIGR01451 family)
MTAIIGRTSENELRISILVVSVLFLGLVTDAQADTFTLDFNSLPSDQGWTYSGSPLDEGAAFSVNGTRLEQTTVASGENSTASYEISDAVDSNKFMTLSFTARVLGYEDISCGTSSCIGTGFYFRISDSGIRHEIGLTDSQINVDDQIVAVDTTTLHDYVFEMHPDGSSDLFVDGVLLVSAGGLRSVWVNRILFGDWASEENADAEISALSFVVEAPDIDVRKSVNNEFPSVDEPVEFTVDVNNIGDQMAADVVIIDQLPAEMIIPIGTAAFTSVGSYDPSNGEWDIGDLDAGTQAVLVVPAVINDAGGAECIANFAVASHPRDLNQDNDMGVAVIHQNGTVHCVDLDVEFGVSSDSNPSSQSCDSRERYEGDATVTNYGPDPARNVVVTITQDPVVGPNLRFDDADCSNSPASQCTIAEIAAGETVTIDVTSDPYQSYDRFTQTIAVSATTSGSDYEVSNNNPSASGSGWGFSECLGPVDIEVPFFGDGSGCFIATAAYGSPLHANLDVLRDFRDRFMLPNRPGRALVAFYYRHSPPLADFIADRDWLRAIVRGLLIPIVYTIKYPWLAWLLIFSAIAAAVIRRRRRRVVL